MKHFYRCRIVKFCLVLALAGLDFSVLGAALAQDSLFETKKIVPFVPSPQPVVDKMIGLPASKKAMWYTISAPATDAL